MASAIDTEESNEKKRTGITYDPIMLEYSCPWPCIETPDRIKEPYERCKLYGLLDYCEDIKGRFATDEEIKVKHTQDLIDLMEKTETMAIEEIKELSKKSPAIYYHNMLNKAAKWALGSSIELLDSIMTGRILNGFAIIRPPGHHASLSELPNGCCYFNNAAICAQIAIDKYNLKRVLIVDWDVHHGQGTQRLFYNDPKVLYCSIHRYDFGHFWPKLRESDFDYIGEGDGKGFNINIPLNKPGFGNSDYMAIFNNIILPVAYEFNPELIIISCGFDSCLGCFSGRMKVTPSCYAHFINSLSTLANGKLCVLLEGGYDIKALSEGVALTLRALLGYPCPRIDELIEPDQMIVDTIQNLKAVLRPYWHCLRNLNEENPIQIDEWLKTFDEKRKNVPFITEETKPKEYPLTFGTAFTKEEADSVNEEFNRALNKTDLDIEQCQPILDCLSTQVWDMDEESDLSSLTDLLINIIADSYSKHMSRKSVITLPWYPNFNILNSIEKSVQNIQEKHNLKKFLIVNFGENPDYKDIINDKASIVFISLNCKQFKVSRNGYSISLPYNPLVMGNAEYINLFLHIIMPIAYQHNPKLVIFIGDSKSAIGDDQGAYELKPIGFAYICKMLLALANGCFIITLFENDEARVKKAPFMSALHEHPSLLSLGSMKPSKESAKNIKDAVSCLKQYWSCFKFDGTLPAIIY